MNIADQLRKFRIKSEKQAGTAATEIDVPLTSVIDDFCHAFRIPLKQRQRILGRRNYTRLETTHIGPVLITSKKRTTRKKGAKRLPHAQPTAVHEGSV